MISQQELQRLQDVQRRASRVTEYFRERAASEFVEPGPLTLDGDLVVDADPHLQAVDAVRSQRYFRLPLIFLRCLLWRAGLGRYRAPHPVISDD